MANIVMKIVAALLIHQTMSVAVRGDLMSPGRGFFHQMREALADPAQKEAGDLHIFFAKDAPAAC